MDRAYGFGRGIATVYDLTVFGLCPNDDRKVFRTLKILDEYSRECLTIRVDCKLKSGDAIDVHSDLIFVGCVPSFIRSDNGPEFIAQAVQGWIKVAGAMTAYIEPESTWENGFAAALRPVARCAAQCESLNGHFRVKLMNGEIFYSLREAQIKIEQRRRHYNTRRRQSALGYRPPASETIVSMDQVPVMH